MHRIMNADFRDRIDPREASRLTEIAIAPDGGSFSIVADNPDAGSEHVSLSANEVPRLIVALLRTAELLERERGGERALIFPIEKGSIALWEGDFVFRVTLTAGASMTFQLGRASAASLFEALSTAFHCPTFPPSATH
jgi:hypothetical protein